MLRFWWTLLLLPVPFLPASALSLLLLLPLPCTSPLPAAHRLHIPHIPHIPQYHNTTRAWPAGSLEQCFGVCSAAPRTDLLPSSHCPNGRTDEYTGHTDRSSDGGKIGRATPTDTHSGTHTHLLSPPSWLSVATTPPVLMSCSLRWLGLATELGTEGCSVLFLFQACLPPSHLIKAAEASPRSHATIRNTHAPFQPKGKEKKKERQRKGKKGKKESKKEDPGSVPLSYQPTPLSL